MQLIGWREDGRLPIRWLAAFAALALIAAAVDIGGTELGRLIGPAVGLTVGDQPDVAFRVVAAIFVAAVILGAAWLARFFSFGVQVLCVWLGLLFIFLFFFYSFDLKYSVIFEKLPFLTGIRLTPKGFLQGAALTLFLCVFAILFSTALGLLAALGKLTRNPILYGTATFYISFFRGTPLLVQIFLIYLGLPQVGLVIEAIPAGIIALSLNYGAYLGEIFRAGIESIAHGQREAALALGLRPGIIMRKIILPQAMRVIVPPTGGQFIAMLKDSSLVSMMGIWELMFLARSFGRSEYRYIEMFVAAAIIYWVLSVSFELVQARIERHYGKGFRR